MCAVVTCLVCERLRSSIRHRVPHRMLSVLLGQRPLFCQALDIRNMDCVPINGDNNGVELFSPPFCPDFLQVRHLLELAEMERPYVALFVGVFDSSAI